jgi:hypothetical protein
MDSLETFFNRRKKSNRKQKDNRLLVATSRQMDCRCQAHTPEEPLDLRRKALGRAHLPATKEISNSFVTFGDQTTSVSQCTSVSQ